MVAVVAVMAVVGGPAGAAVRLDARLGGRSGELHLRQEDHAVDEPAVPRHPQHAHLADDARPQQDRHHPLRDAHHDPRPPARHLRRPGKLIVIIIIIIIIIYLSLSFGQGSSLLWTHTLRPFIAGP